MSLFKNTIKNAIALHKELHNEVITMPYVAAKLYPKSNPHTQYELLRKLTHERVNGDKLVTLHSIFPDTIVSAWFFPDYQSKLIQRFESLLMVDEIGANKDLTQLWEFINRGWMYGKLINRYL